ncbi:hypothetical protein [Streptomyces noursei]|nr:hypothetical protein [Streptomyces noursei]
MTVSGLTVITVSSGQHSQTPQGQPRTGVVPAEEPAANSGAGH